MQGSINFNVEQSAVIMTYWSKQHRSFAVERYFCVGESVIQVQRDFRKHFNIQPRYPIPSRSSILRWVKNFRETSTASNKKRTGRKKSSRTPENIEKVRNSLQTSPRRSLRKRAQAVKLSLSTTRRIIRHELNYHPYKLAVTQKLNPDDYQKRKSFSEKMLDKIENDEIDADKILFTDEAHFHLTGAVNKQNTRYWAPTGDNPQAIEEKPLHEQRVTVWAGVAAWGIVGPFFFDGNVNTARYAEMLNTFLIPTLRRRRRLSSTWFQQDGATCHTSNETMNILSKAFGNRMISKRADLEWPPRSPDLTAPDFFYGDI